MLSSLDAAYAFIKETPRARSPVEAAPSLNRAYVDLIFAWGHKQAGNELRATQLLDQSRAVLEPLDAVHQVALRAFGQRLRERNTSPWVSLDIDLSRLEIRDRYKARRLLETLAILSLVEALNPVSHYWREVTAKTELPPPEDAITAVLVADGQGRVEAVRTGLEVVFASTHCSGAVLIGPCRRAGREAELLSWLRQRPAPDVAVALEALGAGERVEHQFEALAADTGIRMRSARCHIGALALCGRTAEAEALAAQAWRVATDSFHTNSHFTAVALGLCETIVLSALRHELAPGNRSQLDPVP